MELFGWLSAGLFTISYIPQIVRTQRLKTVDDISVSLFVLNAAAYMTGLTYGFYLDKYALMFNYSAGLVLTSIIVLQWVVYRDPRKDQIRKIVSSELKNLRKDLGK